MPEIHSCEWQGWDWNPGRSHPTGRPLFHSPRRECSTPDNEVVLKLKKMYIVRGMILLMRHSREF